MKKEKRLLYISNRVFWPPMGGHEVELYHYCQGLHDKYGYLVDVYIFDTEEKINGMAKPEFLNEVMFACPIYGLTKISNIICKSLLSNEKWPLQNSLYFSRENKKKIRCIVEKNQYDVVIVDMIRLATYYGSLYGFNCKKILNIDDTLSKRYKRQLKAMTSKTDIAGQYYSKLPKLVRSMLGSSIIKKIILKMEIPRMERAEKRFSELYDHVIFVSPIETAEFNKKYKTSKAVTISLGVDYPYFSEPISVNKEPGKVVYVGNMVTSANADSVRFIVNEVLSKCKNVKRAVFIGDCPESLFREFDTNKIVHFSGKVSDLREEVKKGMVFLAPIAYGTGIKTKILEAMAMEMPVVTNSVGAEGIPGVNGKHWCVSDNPIEIASYVDSLLESQEKCDEVGKAAKQFVGEYFQWDIVLSQFGKLGL